MAVLPTLPLYIEERFALRDPEAVRRWSGIVFAAGPFAAAVVGPLWGALGDRLGRRVMAVRSVLAIAVVMALMPLMPTPELLAGLRLVQGLFAGYVAPAIALVSAQVPPERQGRTIARLQVALAMGTLLGPPLGAELSVWFGRAAVFWVTSGLALAGVLPLCLATEAPPASRPAPGPMWRGLWRELRRAAGSAPFVLMLLLVFVLRFGMNMVEPFLALWVRELGPMTWLPGQVFDLEHALDRTTAAMFLVLAVAQIAFTPQWGRLADRFGPVLCLALAAFGLGALQVLQGSAGSVDVAFALRCGATAFMAGMMTLAYAAAARRAPVERSLAFACVQSCIQFGLSLGPVTGAALAEGHSVRGLFTLSGLLLFAAGVGLLLLRLLAPRPKDATIPTEIDERT
jgi:DHA1 family multidrug resistance protein-like MFS transporter